MPKSVEKCVQKLMDDPKFNPKLKKGKTKKDAAWAICQSHYNKGKEGCTICEMEDEKLFQEAVEAMMKIMPELNEENYTLDGIEISLFSESISKEDLGKINKFSVKPVEEKDVVVYTALLIDDKITRNNTLYNKDFQSMLLSLPAGEGNFIGAPILFGQEKDHQHTASSQVGRIFDAWQVVSQEKNYGVMAKVYIIKETNEDLISKIDTGVIKEMSISTKVEMPICSVCGQNITTCEHTPGLNNCYIIMSGSGFVAEASFVAVPGSNSAKILNEDEMKNFLRLENLKDLVSPIIKEQLVSIPSFEESIKAYKESIEALQAELVSLKTTMEGIQAKFKENETTVYPFDMLSALRALKEDVDTGKEFVIKNMARYNLTGSEFRADSIPDMTQGLRGEDTNLIVKILFDNIEILGINMSKIESYLKIVPAPTNMTYTGDINDLVGTVRFMNQKIDNLKNRMYKLEGKFDLELQERNSIIKETIKFGILSEKFGFNDKNLSEKFFEKFSTEEIVKLKDQYFVAAQEKFTPKPIEKKIIKESSKEEDKLSLREAAKKFIKGGKNG